MTFYVTKAVCYVFFHFSVAVVGAAKRGREVVFPLPIFCFTFVLLNYGQKKKLISVVVVGTVTERAEKV